MQCYFLEPLKKDVARQVTYGKDSYKVCKALEKKNPDFCSMRYRASIPELGIGGRVCIDCCG